MGNAGMNEIVCRQMAEESGHLVIDVEYRLAPRHPFPAALDDVVDVIKWAVDKDAFNQERISLSGFSAGDNLALSTASVLKSGRVKSVIAFYPPCDLSDGRDHDLHQTRLVNRFHPLSRASSMIVTVLLESIAVIRESLP